MSKEIKQKEGYSNIEYVGLTKREQIAAMALQGLLSREGAPDIKYEVFLAVKAADALLAELEK